MKLNPAKFNKFENGIAQDFYWRKAVACPCVTATSGQAKTSCPHCHGAGRIWGTAIPGKACIVGRDVMMKFAKFGQYTDEDIMISIPSDSPIYGMGVFDRIECRNRTESFSMNMVYGVNDIMKFNPITVERAFWLNDLMEIVEGTVPKVFADGTLHWSGITPPARKTFSITGRKYAEFYAYASIPLDRAHHAGADLPRRVVLRNFSLYTGD